MIIYEARLAETFSVFFEKKEDAEAYISLQKDDFFGSVRHELIEREIWRNLSAYLREDIA